MRTDATARARGRATGPAPRDGAGARAHAGPGPGVECRCGTKPTGCSATKVELTLDIGQDKNLRAQNFDYEENFALKINFGNNI